MIDDLKTILVTGGGGFIGSHVVDRLVNLQYNVKILDNFSSGNRKNLVGVTGDVEVIQGDLRDSDMVKKVIEGADLVVHLAAAVDVQESIKKPMFYNEVNTTGTLNLLDSSRDKVEKFIFSSSCAVYGDPEKLPIEEDHPVKPQSPYAASKLSAENYCRAYLEPYGLKTIIFRLFNVYGPRQGFNQYGGVITKFISRIRSGLPPVIFGDGEQTRDFIYVGDVAELIVKAVDSDASGTFNVGTGTSVSINRLAYLLLNIMNSSKMEPTHVEGKHGEIRHSKANISEAKRVFGFKSRVDLEEGLRKTVRQFVE